MYSVQTLVSRFTDYFYKRQDGNLYKLLSIIADELQHAKTTIDTVRAYRSVETAEGVGLDVIGANVGQPRGIADDETYRTLIKARILRNRTDGTVNMVSEVLSTVLSTDEFTIRESWQDNETQPAIKIRDVSLDTLLDSGNSLIDFVAVAQRTVAAAVRVDEVYVDGDFILTDVDMPETPHGLADIDSTVGGKLDVIYNASNTSNLPLD